MNKNRRYTRSMTMSSKKSSQVPARREAASYNPSLVAINIVGFILSAYAHHVGVAKKSEADYQAFCDISEAMSCSRVLTSSYSSGFGIIGKLFGESSALNVTNSAMGMCLYTLLGILSLSNSKFVIKLHFILTILSNIGSVYLAIILFTVLRDFCLVCSLTYVVNAINIVLVYKKLQPPMKKYSQKQKE